MLGAVANSSTEYPGSTPGTTASDYYVDSEGKTRIIGLDQIIGTEDDIEVAVVKNANNELEYFRVLGNNLYKAITITIDSVTDGTTVYVGNSQGKLTLADRIDVTSLYLQGENGGADYTYAGVTHTVEGAGLLNTTDEVLTIEVNNVRYVVVLIDGDYYSQIRNNIYYKVVSNALKLV